MWTDYTLNIEDQMQIITPIHFLNFFSSSEEPAECLPRYSLVLEWNLRWMALINHLHDMKSSLASNFQVMLHYILLHFISNSCLGNMNTSRWSIPCNNFMRKSRRILGYYSAIRYNMVWSTTKIENFEEKSKTASFKQDQLVELVIILITSKGKSKTMQGFN